MSFRQTSGIRLGAVVCAMALAVTVVGAAGAPAGAASGGSISGRVLDGSANPLSGICVGVAGGPGVQTDASGAYSLAGLAAGSYAVQYSDCNPTPQFRTQWYLGHSDQASADEVAVVDLTDTPLLDVVLESGVAVSGTVTDGSGNPIANVNVNVNPTPSGGSGWAQTDAAGTYSTEPLAPGSYRVQFSPTDPQWAGQYWNDEPGWSAADLLVLTAADGPVHGGVDAHLASAATIEGTVTGTGGSVVSGICVDANVPNGSNGWDGVGSTTTAADGTYSLTGLPPRDVRVRFRECGSGPYVDQWYSGQPDFNDSTAIVLTPGAVRPGVDAQLSTGTSLRGTVTDEEGAPIPNVFVNVNPTTAGASGWAQTDADGNYTTNALPPGDYRVQFQGTGSFAGEYWHDEPSWNSADIVTIAASDGPVRDGFDAQLAPAASVSGVVSDPDGQPAGNVCVSANIDTSQGTDYVGGATTAADGTYTITGLPPMAVKIDFRDCNAVGPYVEQWWNDQPDESSANAIVLAPGDARTGIDARLVAAGAITGTVTDGSGHPLAGICAQATTASFVGGLAGTDSDGHYSIVLAEPGDYRVQFVDCNQPPSFAGQWWNGRSSAATAQLVTVATGDVVDGIDAVLAPGAAGSISGKVLSARGTGMTTACVIAYLPTQFALVGPVQPDGSYTIPNVPSGTFALAFVGCTGGDPTQTVADPGVSGVSYSAAWWQGVPLTIAGNGNGGPDPIAQGARLVTVAPGENLTGHDACFGCNAIGITSVTPGASSLTVAFTAPRITAPGVTSTQNGGSPSVTAQGAAIDYTVTCTPTGGGEPVLAGGSGSPITVSGLVAGATYTCQTLAAVDGTIVATSAVSDPLTVEGATVGPSPADETTATGAEASGGLARTGANAPFVARLGAVLLALGVLLVGATRRRRRGEVVGV